MGTGASSHYLNAELEEVITEVLSMQCETIHIAAVIETGAVRWLFVCLLLLGCGGAPAMVTAEPTRPSPTARMAIASSRSGAAAAPLPMATGIRYGNPASPPPKPEIPPDWVEHRATNPNPTVAYAWVEILLETTGRDIVSVGTPRPTIISRQMSVPLTAMYD